MSTNSVINLRAKSGGFYDLRYTRIESTSADCSTRLACDIDTEGVRVTQQAGIRARSKTSIELFRTCLGQRAASVADQLDRPPAPLDLVSLTELSPMLVPRSLVSIGPIHFASALCWCWWLVAVVGELTSSFLITSLL